MEGKGRAPTGGTVASEREGGSGERAAAQARRGAGTVRAPLGLRGLLGRGGKGRLGRCAGPGWRGGPALLGQRTAGRRERCWAGGFGPKGEGNAGLLGCLGWFGSGWGFVFSSFFLFPFLLQTHTN